MPQGPSTTEERLDFSDLLSDIDAVNSKLAELESQKKGVENPTEKKASVDLSGIYTGDIDFGEKEVVFKPVTLEDLEEDASVKTGEPTCNHAEHHQHAEPQREEPQYAEQHLKSPFMINRMEQAPDHSSGRVVGQHAHPSVYDATRDKGVGNYDIDRNTMTPISQHEHGHGIPQRDMFMDRRAWYASLRDIVLTRLLASLDHAVQSRARNADVLGRNAQPDMNYRNGMPYGVSPANRQRKSNNGKSRRPKQRSKSQRTPSQRNARKEYRTPSKSGRGRTLQASRKYRKNQRKSKQGQSSRQRAQNARQKTRSTPRKQLPKQRKNRLNKQWSSEQETRYLLRTLLAESYSYQKTRVSLERAYSKARSAEHMSLLQSEPKDDPLTRALHMYLGNYRIEKLKQAREVSSSRSLKRQLTSLYD